MGSVYLTAQPSRQRESKKMLTVTEWQIVRMALDEMHTDSVAHFVDDDGQPITVEWLEKLSDKLDKLSDGEI